MKTGLTIQQMAQELLRQSKAKQDYLVNTGSLSLSVTSDAPQLRVTENGLDKIAPLDIRQTAHRQLGTYLGIPQKYYELMRTDAPELLAYNANYWFSQKNELRTLRTMDGCARAFLSNRYRRIDNLDIASVTLPVIGELPEARFVSTQITEDFMYIKVVNPRLQADVVPGDVVQAGVIISNSETGLGSVTIQPLIYRLVCSNGMVINDAKTRRNHVGRAATSDEDFSIYSNETLLADESNDVQQIKRGVQIMVKESRRLTNMVEELLQFSRLEDGRFTLQVEDTDLQAELEDAVYSYRELFRQDGIALEYSSDRAEYGEVISGDPERLKQVFCNLLDNAAKHGGSGKRIAVHLSQQEGEYVITIRDFGPGIPEAELPYVKQKFYKGSSKARGSGIGLAVCDEIVQRHGGRLDIANAEGGGTVVTVYLPLKKQAEQEL